MYLLLNTHFCDKVNQDYLKLVKNQTYMHKKSGTRLPVPPIEGLRITLFR